MFANARRRFDKVLMAIRPRFAPRLEALESRYAPTCSFNPSSGALIADSGEPVLLYYVPWSDGQDIYCNFQYVGTNYSDIYFGGNGNNKIEIDTTLSTSAGNYVLNQYSAEFGNNVIFYPPDVVSVAF